MVSEKDLECYRKAGRIVGEIRKAVPDLVQEGTKVVDICERVESMTLRLGGKPAFPCNVGVNEVAAHYTSPFGDISHIPKGAIVKVDFGAHVDGFIADSAITISLNPRLIPMVLSAEEALRKALEIVRPGVRASEIGALIQDAIERRGFRPIWNLTGHVIERYIVHTGESIPNVARMRGGKLREGQICAVEPFVTSTSAKGEVRDSDKAYIFRFSRKKGANTAEGKRLVEHIEREFRTLPFAERWLSKADSVRNVDAAFDELIRSKCVLGYPVLVERSGEPVAQAEHTVLITEDGYENLTA
jgi:methionyl aminopeptidase